MKWEVKGVNRDTGKNVKATIEADNEESATRRANRAGIMVESIRAIDPADSVAGVVQSSIPTPQIQRAPQQVTAVAVPPHQSVAMPAQQINLTMNATRGSGTSGLGIAALVIGIIACLGSWIPLIGLLTIPISVIGLILATIGFIISLTGRKSSVGMPVAGAISCILAIIVAFTVTAGTGVAIGSAMNESLKQAENNTLKSDLTVPPKITTGKVPETPAPNVIKPAKDDWIVEPNGSITAGNLSISLTNYVIGHWLISRRDTTIATPEQYLVIEVQIVNKSDTKRVDYKSWQSSGFSIGRGFAYVKDEFGNHYKRIDFGFDIFPKGHVENATIEPEGKITDVMVFEKPIPKSTKLIIELPGENIGLDEKTLKFEIKKPVESKD